MNKKKVIIPVIVVVLILLVVLFVFLLKDKDDKNDDKKETTTTTSAATTTVPEEAKQTTVTTTAPVIKITQSDVDKLVSELQEYGDKIYVSINGVSMEQEVIDFNEDRHAEFERYKELLPSWYADVQTVDEDIRDKNGNEKDTDKLFYCGWATYEDYLENKTPSNSSWGGTNRYNIYESLEERQAEQCLKDEIDYCYENYPNCHVVIYAEYFPDGFVWEGAQCTDYPCYVFWCLR